MDEKNNPFEFFKDIPYFSEKVVKEIAGEGWFDPAEILNHFGQQSEISGNCLFCFFDS